MSAPQVSRPRSWLVFFFVSLFQRHFRFSIFSVAACRTVCPRTDVLFSPLRRLGSVVPSRHCSERFGSPRLHKPVATLPHATRIPVGDVFPSCDIFDPPIWASLLQVESACPEGLRWALLIMILSPLLASLLMPRSLLTVPFNTLSNPVERISTPGTSQ